ncbi:DUF1778 domain-containing protein [Methylocapsa sp. S129]|uniref:type II toxin-antitoxin system TacA family antitoxin n=1 Tax=Methylocapsa sp. S129 TaxID=1641869 RepID=UPI00131DE6F5|nr:DUF1778 domain-containing protein [Methylocapsa sp. S129]
MARIAIENDRIDLRIRPDDKALLTRAAALERLDLTGFILRTVLPKARSVVKNAGRVVLSDRDTLRVLDLLENPPAPSVRLARAAKAAQTLP